MEHVADQRDVVVAEDRVEGPRRTVQRGDPESPGCEGRREGTAFAGIGQELPDAQVRRGRLAAGSDLDARASAADGEIDPC